MVSREELLKKIINVCDFENENIIEATELEALDDWDSLALINIISLFKKELNIILDVSKLKRCKTFSDILDLIK